MKFILHVHTLPWVSGSGINTFLSMKLLNKQKYRTALACAPGGRLEELVREYDFPFFPLHHMKAEVSPHNDIRALFELKTLFKKLRPDIVHTHNSKAGFLGRLAARMTNARARVRPKIVHTVHGFAFHDKESFARQLLFKSLERTAFSWADRTVAISEALAEWGARETIGKKSDYTILWSGIEVERFANASREEGRKILGVSNDVLLIGLVAKLWDGKGHEFLINAATPLLSDKVKLVFIGEGPLRERLTAIKNPHVIFAGFQANVAPVTKALDIAVLPSEFEGMGRVLLEAQSAGVPVIANNVGGVSDVVKSGGILVAAHDQSAWRSALRNLIDNPDRRRQMGDEGSRFVGERFSANAMVRGLEEIYETL